MSESEKGSAQTQETSGQPESTQDKVSHDTYLRVLKEAKKAKELLKQYESERQQMEETKLREQNEWKTLADQYKVQLDQTNKKLTEQEESIVNGLKSQAFEKHLGGRLKAEEYKAFVPFDKIILDPETKSINDDSVKMAVSEFVKRHSHLVEFQSARVPNAAPSGYGNIQAKKPTDMTKEELEKYIISKFS